MNQENMSLSNEMEQLLLLVEKIGEMAHLMIQNKAIKKTEEQKKKEAQELPKNELQANAKDQTADKSQESLFQSPESAPPKEFMKLLEDINREVIVIRKKLVDQTKEQSQEQEGEKTEPKLTMEQEEIKREIEKLDQDLSKVEKDAKQLKKTPVHTNERMTLLKAIGAGMISIENRRLNLGEKIKNFFKQIPNQVELGYSRWMVNQLNKHNSRVNELNQLLSKESIQENQIQKAETVIEKENMAETVKASDLPSKSEQLLVDMDKQIQRMALNVEALKQEHELEKQVHSEKEKQQESMVTQDDPEVKETAPEKSVGIETEIDPVAGSMESVHAREAQGLGTVSSVKEEMEDVLMTDYGETMEEAYAESIDPDPDASAFPTDQQRLEAIDDGYGYDDYNDYGYDELER